MCIIAIWLIYIYVVVKFVQRNGDHIEGLTCGVSAFVILASSDSISGILRLNISW